MNEITIPPSIRISATYAGDTMPEEIVIEIPLEMNNHINFTTIISQTVDSLSMASYASKYGRVENEVVVDP